VPDAMSQDSGFHPALDASCPAVAMVVVGNDGVIRHHTPAVTQMLARGVEDLVGRSLPALFAPGGQEAVDALLRRLSDAHMRLGTFIEATCPAGAGPPRWLRLTGARLSEEPGLVVIVLSQLVDRPKPTTALDGARLAAQSDQLTGLLNRRAMDEIARAFFDGPESRQAVVALWDIDGLKLINDTHGHAVGDQVVRWVGYRLEGTLGALGAVARFGGDEFSVLLPDVSAAKGKAMLRHAMEAIRMPMGALDVQVAVSCGATWSTTATSWETMLGNADRALYEGKRSNDDDVTFLSDGD
jgi:diguanylate cyclase (GGDEF)-like protein